MPTFDPHLVATFPHAESSIVGQAVRLLQAHGFVTTQAPMYDGDSGGAVVRKGDVEIHLLWFLGVGLTVRCINRVFEKERDDAVALLRSLGPSR